jgi:phosphatidylglycerol:prolipoprotein diacylglycerol transferase
MHPVLFELPAWNIKIHAYGVLILLACAGALWIAAFKAKQGKINVNSVYELAVWLYLGGVIGARTLFVVFHAETINSPVDLLRSWQGGNVFYGCIIGGLIGSLIYWRRNPFPFWPMADVAALALGVGITLGRVGCFLNGCCYGSVSDRPWAIRFPQGSHAWIAQIEAGILPPAATSSLSVHPTQLYAAVSGFLILAFLLVFFPFRRRDGEVMGLLMILYPLTRWPMESLRGDEPAIFLSMTLSQNISLALLVAGLCTWAWISRQPAVRFADQTSGGEVVSEPRSSKTHLLQPVGPCFESTRA